MNAWLKLLLLLLWRLLLLLFGHTKNIKENEETTILEKMQISVIHFIVKSSSLIKTCFETIVTMELYGRDNDNEIERRKKNWPAKCGTI